MTRLQSRHTTQVMMIHKPKTTALPDDKWTIHCGTIKEACEDEATAYRQAHQWASCMVEPIIISLNGWPFDIMPHHALTTPPKL